MKILSCSIFAMLAFVAAPSASAQVSRIALETRHCQHENYVNVYEYDFVDVQPQFPGDDRGLMNYINHERKYPCDAYRSHIQRACGLQFYRKHRRLSLQRVGDKGCPPFARQGSDENSQEYAGVETWPVGR